ncbi:hypothetical protein RF11_07492 [Thelohanellus kitauei]|uniref:Uncharacterized protein n=1 Tax=Thelohanellus kitauei TaxID=669202 RepID=A0A0C2JXR5_THEKT|nr:hypothetical protein RF11_07492 [Thelohanellus kitauei]
MSSILVYFNEETYIDSNRSSFYTFLANKLISRNSSINKSHQGDHNRIRYESTYCSNISEGENERDFIIFHNLLSLFVIIYEMKFIFVDINSKIKDFNFS